MATSDFAPSFSTDEICRGTDRTRCLTDDLDTIETDISSLETSKADTSHTHSEYAAVDHTHSGYAAADHTHSDYALVNHVHTEYAATDHTHSGYATTTELSALETEVSGKADANHTHTGYATSVDLTTLESEVEGKADANHTHTGYAAANHTHTGYATTDDLSTLETAVNSKADANHTHTGYASTDHTHDEYFPIDGGTVNGDTNVAGVLRIQGKQAFYYDTTENSQVIGTNNATGGTTVCCGSSATTVMNGANLKAPNILPRGNNTFTLGSTSLRWKGIYSTAAVNVSSDIRMKRDVKVMDEDELAEFVDNLIVVSYHYNWDSSDRHPRIGLIAQDVQMANAELADYFVSEDADGMLGIRPADLVFPLIAAVQRLSERVAELEAK